MFGRTLVKIQDLITLVSKIERLGAESRARDAEIVRLTGECQALHGQNARLQIATQEWRVEELALHKSTAVAKTMCDLLRVELNASREKEAALLAQVLPTLKMAIPKMETDDALLAGTALFDDMGDREAARSGLSDFIPVDGTPQVHGAPKTPTTETISHE